MILHEGHPVDPVTGKVYGREIATHIDPSGYRQVYKAKAKTIQAHRFIWEAVHGPIPAGLVINHINGIKTDNRIENLELATQQENVRHAWRTGLNTPVRGEASGMAKLTNIRVMAIRALAQFGVPDAEIARRSGVSRRQVSSIRRRVAWQHIPPFTAHLEDM